MPLAGYSQSPPAARGRFLPVVTGYILWLKEYRGLFAHQLDDRLAHATAFRDLTERLVDFIQYKVLLIHVVVY